MAKKITTDVGDRYLDKNGNWVDLARLLNGKSAEQQNVIRYFFDLGNGCCGKKMKDEEYLEIVKKNRGENNYKQRALNKIGVDEDMVQEIPPVTFEGFTPIKAYTKKKDDGKYVCSRYEITWLFFGDEQVYLYRYAFCLDDGSKTEETNEYFYKDITSFSTLLDYEETTTATGKDTIETNIFRLAVPGDTFSCSMEATPDNGDAISAMKQKLREKKNV